MSVMGYATRRCDSESNKGVALLSTYVVTRVGEAQNGSSTTDGINRESAPPRARTRATADRADAARYRHARPHDERELRDDAVGCLAE